MIYHFEGGTLDDRRRELRRGGTIVAVEPQVFDLLQFLLRNRDRVVSKEDLLAAVWQRRIVSESTLSSRITAVRQAIGDSGGEQRLIRTVARKGLRFVGAVREADGAPSPSIPPAGEPAAQLPSVAHPQRRQLTIMLCEVDPGCLAARSDPEAQRERAAAFYRCVKAAVAERGGFVGPYASGAVIAYFGHPQAHEDDAERALRAALALSRAAAAMAGPVRVRIGIDTGLVVVGGLLDGDAASDHAVVGESTAITAVLADRCPHGGIVISAATHELVGRLFDYREIDPVTVQGRESPVRAWQVLGESTTANRFAALRQYRAQIFGRDEELELLHRRFEQALSGEGRVVLIWGEAGIGKSRLIAAMQERTTVDHYVLAYYCSPHRSQTALHPIVAEIESSAGFERGDDNLTKLHKLEAWVRAGSTADVALVAELLSLPVDGRDPRPALGPQRRKELLLDFAVGRVVDLAARKPVLLVLEDAHWIDPTSREWLDLVIDSVRSLPVLAVVTYRPEFDPPWLGQSHVTTLTLNRLGRRDSAALVKRSAGGRDLPSPLLDDIVARTDGVPLFLEEMTKSVLESGILREAEGALVLASPSVALSIPATLQASLVARFDRLPEAREVVQTGAALGREWSYAVLQAVLDMPDATLAPLIDQLVQSELVHQRGTVPHAVYTFKHALVQDAAYATMLSPHRTRVHRRIADVLESQFGDEVLRHPDVLAYHCTAAGAWEKALDYRIKAARMAVERSAGIESQGHVDLGVDLLPRIAAGSSRRQLEGRLMAARADALVMTRGFASPEVMAALSRARELLDSAAHPAESLRALCGQFNYHLIRSESPRCLALTEPFLDHETDDPTKTVIHYLVATACLHLGQFARSIHYLESALSLYDELSCRPVAFVAGYHIRSFTLIWLGLGRLYAGAVREAGETVAAAVADARRRSHPFTLVSALLALARFRSHTHDIAGAIEATDEGFAIATEQRSPYHVSRAGILRGVNAIDSGRPEEGIALMTRALEAHRATGANFQSSCNLSKLAEAHAHLGRFDAALELAQQAIDDVERTGERWWEAEAWRVRGTILLAASPAHRSEAVACFARALACARHQGARLWEARAVDTMRACNAGTRESIEER